MSQESPAFRHGECQEIYHGPAQSWIWYHNRELYTPYIVIIYAGHSCYLNSNFWDSISHGRDYTPAENNKPDRIVIGTIPVNSNYNPVQKANYAFEEKRDRSLRDEELDTRTVLTVDLGVNNDAVCSVMRTDGTVLAQKFIILPREKDRLQHLLNRIRRQQREHGRTGGRRTWDKVNRINDQLTAIISNGIVDIAVEYVVNVIVLETLNFQGKIRGSKKQRLHLWRKKAIQNMVEHKAHRNLIRASRVCAWGTNKLAFDGSGEVLRGRINLSGKELSDLLAMTQEKRKTNKGSLGGEVHQDRPIKYEIRGGF